MRLRFLVIHDGSLSENIAASSIIHSILDIDNEAHITWAAPDKNTTCLFDYTRCCSAIPITEIKEHHKKCDIFINLSPTFDTDNIKSRQAIGFGFTKDDDKYFRILYENEETHLNIFQVYYKLCGMTWKGKGPGFTYYPGTKTSARRVGLSLANANLRNYVTEQLELPVSKLWHIPYKKNVLKRMDHINKCNQIVTDDMTSMLLAIYLRKYVYFLKAIPLNMNIELFNNGQLFDVPGSFLR